MAETPDRRGAETLDQERIDTTDSLWFSPRERAELVLAILQAGAKATDWDFSFYDALCFSVEWLGKVTINELPEDEELRDLAFGLGKWLNQRHYFHTQDVLGDPDRKEKKDDGVDASVGESEETSNGTLRDNGSESGSNSGGEVSGLHRDSSGPEEGMFPDDGEDKGVV